MEFLAIVVPNIIEISGADSVNEEEATSSRYVYGQYIIQAIRVLDTYICVGAASRHGSGDVDGGMQ